MNLTILAAVVCMSLCETSPVDSGQLLGAWKLQETSLDLSVVAGDNKAHQPQEVYVLFTESKMILVTRWCLPEYNRAECYAWEIEAFDQLDLHAIAYVQFPTARKRQKLSIQWSLDQSTLDIKLHGLPAEQMPSVTLRCERDHQQDANRSLRAIMATKSIHASYQARSGISHWLERSHHAIDN